MLDTSGFFDFLFRNAKYNAVIIMDEGGIIQKVNQAFMSAFGYAEEDICGRSFDILFTESDRSNRKPELELATALSQGNCNDDNYLVTKSGHPIWVTGESVACKDGAGANYLIKVIHNIHVQKMLQQLLMESHEFVDNLFQSITDSGLLVLDMQLKVVKANAAFCSLFGLQAMPPEGHKLSELQHLFWQDKGIRQQLREMIITNDFFTNRSFRVSMPGGEPLVLDVYARPLDSKGDHQNSERRILLVIKKGEAS